MDAETGAARKELISLCVMFAVGAVSVAAVSSRSGATTAAGPRDGRSSVWVSQTRPPTVRAIATSASARTPTSVEARPSRVCQWGTPLRPRESEPPVRGALPSRSPKLDNAEDRGTGVRARPASPSPARLRAMVSTASAVEPKNDNSHEAQGASCFFGRAKKEAGESKALPRLEFGRLHEETPSVLRLGGRPPTGTSYHRSPPFVRASQHIYPKSNV